MGVNSFHDLEVWKRAMELSKETYRVSNKLPREEVYGLVSQMRRCAVSIPSNIAEGSKRGSRKDYLQFLKMASGSAAELETQLLLARDIHELHIEGTQRYLKEVQKMLESLMQSLTTKER